VAAVRKLLREGADPNIKNKHGELFPSCAPEEVAAEDMRQALRVALNDVETVKRRKGMSVRKESTLQMKNRAQRLARGYGTHPRQCGFAVQLWAPPNFNLKGKESKGKVEAVGSAGADEGSGGLRGGPLLQGEVVLRGDAVDEEEFFRRRNHLAFGEAGVGHRVEGEEALSEIDYDFMVKKVSECEGERARALLLALPCFAFL